MDKWFPRLYDIAMLPFERTRFRRIRQDLVGTATGSVLEIGAGTGLNFPYYYQAQQVDAVDPNPLMEQQSLARKRAALVPIRTHLAQAEELPFADNTFDTVVATLVFCTILDPEQAINEIVRVSKPNARILLFEHVRMKQTLLGKAQDWLTPVWKKICDGCHLNRDTLVLLKQTDLSLKHVDSYFDGLFLVMEATNEK
ncbi:class I SAM-dependent methyltransferase [Lentibacillus sp. N15]|uniref:class I SAM-dependent methyltransferase n=1 Tax=Lentibacillus songyuanensis TaxID=3136161 RepID=UPI0031BAC43D